MLPSKPAVGELDSVHLNVQSWSGLSRHFGGIGFRVGGRKVVGVKSKCVIDCALGSQSLFICIEW